MTESNQKSRRPYWTEFFSERQLTEIEFDRACYARLVEPVDPFTLRMIIAKMAEMLDAYGPHDSAEHTNKMKEMCSATMKELPNADAD